MTWIEITYQSDNLTLKRYVPIPPITSKESNQDAEVLGVKLVDKPPKNAKTLLSLVNKTKLER